MTSHRAETEHDGVELGDVHARGGARRVGGGAVDHHDAERAQRQDGDDQRPVDVVIQASLEHAR
jgi:hypothetical protein